MDPMMEASIDRHLEKAVRFHGHLCGGQVIGVRMAMAGLRELGIREPRGTRGRDLVIFIEIDRCVADAIISVTGRTPGKRSIKIVDYGKTAATFVDAGNGKAVRVSVQPDFQTKVAALRLGFGSEHPEKSNDIAALKTIPENDLLTVRNVHVEIRPQDLPGESKNGVNCACCGEMIRDLREIEVDGKTFCRPCAEKKAYYTEIRE